MDDEDGVIEVYIVFKAYFPILPHKDINQIAGEIQSHNNNNNNNNKEITAADANLAIFFFLEFWMTQAIFYLRMQPICLILTRSTDDPDLYILIKPLKRRKTHFHLSLYTNKAFEVRVKSKTNLVERRKTHFHLARYLALSCFSMQSLEQLRMYSFVILIALGLFITKCHRNLDLVTMFMISFIYQYVSIIINSYDMHLIISVQEIYESWSNMPTGLIPDNQMNYIKYILNHHLPHALSGLAASGRITQLLLAAHDVALATGPAVCYLVRLSLVAGYSMCSVFGILEPHSFSVEWHSIKPRHLHAGQPCEAQDWFKHLFIVRMFEPSVIPIGSFIFSLTVVTWEDILQDEHNKGFSVIDTALGNPSAISEAVGEMGQRTAETRIWKRLP
ncbi:hypothetical protein ACJX0J_032231 [Zea mays]